MKVPFFYGNQSITTIFCTRIMNPLNKKNDLSLVTSIELHRRCLDRLIF